MITIWKYLLADTETTLNIPAGPVFLDVQIQDGLPHLWALVNSDNRHVPFSVKIIGTGHPANIEGYKYIGTFQMDDGGYVGHTFIKAVDNA